MKNKECPICNKKLTMMTARIKLKKDDITVCKDCLIKAGYGTGIKDIENISKMVTLNDISEKLKSRDVNSVSKSSSLELEQNADPSLLLKLSKSYVKNFESTLQIPDYIKYNDKTGELLLKNGPLTSWRKSNIRNVKNYEVIQNGKNLQGFGLGRAAAGALLTGGIGLLVGFTKKKEVVTELRLHITLNSIDNPAFDIKFISTKTKTDSFTYRSSIKTLEQITNFLDAALSEQSSEINMVVNNSTPSVADELKKFKDLLDLGAINEDEYNTQKEKLLK